MHHVLRSATLLLLLLVSLPAACASSGAPRASAVPDGPPIAASCTGYVALTFDDGPGPNTTTLLAILQRTGARATLFNIGRNAAALPSLVKAEVDGGHWVENHSDTHPHMTLLLEEEMQGELARASKAISSAGGVAPRLFRPPYGQSDFTLQEVASSLGLRTVTWDVDSQDWNGASTEAIVAAASRLTDGQVILMHDAYQTTNAALPQIVSNLAAKGLCPGRIDPHTGRASAPDAR